MKIIFSIHQLYFPIMTQNCENKIKLKKNENKKQCTVLLTNLECWVVYQKIKNKLPGTNYFDIYHFHNKWTRFPFLMEFILNYIGP